MFSPVWPWVFVPYTFSPVTAKRPSSISPGWVNPTRNWIGVPFLEVFGAATTRAAVDWETLGAPDKSIAEAVPPQLPTVTVEEVKVSSSKFGPPLVFVPVGIRLIKLFPATKGTVTVIVAQLSQLVVTPKFTVTDVETVGETRLKSIGRAMVVPSE